MSFSLEQLYSHGQKFFAGQSISEVGDTLRKLDLQKPEVRQAILEAGDAKSLYESTIAVDY